MVWRLLQHFRLCEFLLSITGVFNFKKSRNMCGTSLPALFWMILLVSSSFTVCSVACLVLFAMRETKVLFIGKCNVLNRKKFILINVKRFSPDRTSYWCQVDKDVRSLSHKISKKNNKRVEKKHAYVQAVEWATVKINDRREKRDINTKLQKSDKHLKRKSVGILAR